MGAGQAIECIAKNVPEWESNVAIVVKNEMTDDEEDEPIQLSFQDFNILEVIEKGKSLLSSGGEEFEIDSTGLDPKQRIALQRRHLLQRLGIDARVNIGQDDWVKDSDFEISNVSSRQKCVLSESCS